MPKTVNLSSDGENLLEEAKSTFDVEPSDRKTVERGLQALITKRHNEDNN